MRRREIKLLFLIEIRGNCHNLDGLKALQNSKDLPFYNTQKSIRNRLIDY